MVTKGGVVMAMREGWLSTSILLLARVGVGNVFTRIALKLDALYSTFVSKILALSFLFLFAACFSGVFKL